MQVSIHAVLHVVPIALTPADEPSDSIFAVGQPQRDLERRRACARARRHDIIVDDATSAAQLMIEFGHLSHVGLRRELNEDTYYGDADMGLWLVADGMGGHEFGEVAAALARDAVVREVKSGKPLSEAIRYADADIIALSRQRQESLPMGTTMVAVLVKGQRFELAWVGDSRAYLWNGQLRQLSSDHSFVQELIDQGAISPEQARTHPNRNVITQALGVTDPENLKVETLSGELKPGMQLLLCSDGLTEEVDDGSIAKHLADKDLSAQECVDQLIHAALDGGGSDNVTVVLLRSVA